MLIGFDINYVVVFLNSKRHKRHVIKCTLKGLMHNQQTNRLLISIACMMLSACTPYAEISVTNAVPVNSGTLAENIGIETLGGVLTPLLKSGCKLPCEATRTFSTADDNQAQIMINLFRGNAAMTAEAKHLGKYQVTGIGPAPRGTPKLAITLRAGSGGLVLRAGENGVKGKLKWAKIQ
jgi:molecular chaperone DnaK (HSP70)